MRRRDPTTWDLMTAIRDMGSRLDTRFDLLSARIDGRIDNLATRIDTLIDSVADVRAEFRDHRHDD